MSQSHLEVSPYFARDPHDTPTNHNPLLTSKYFTPPSVQPPKEGFELFAEIFTNAYLAKPILIQEIVCDSPWKLLIAVMLLNKTSGQVALPIFWLIIWTWPTPELLSTANTNVLTYILAPLGLQNVRAARLVQLSKVFLHQPPQAHILHKSRAKLRNGAPYPRTAVSHLPGCGKYALDSYRIFCMDGGEWKSVLPDDKELKKYLKWRWAMEEFKQWNHIDGVVGDINRAYLERLPLELT